MGLANFLRVCVALIVVLYTRDRHLVVAFEMVEGADHRVVFNSRADYMIARVEQTKQRGIQRICGILGENDV